MYKIWVSTWQKKIQLANKHKNMLDSLIIRECKVKYYYIPTGKSDDTKLGVWSSGNSLSASGSVNWYTLENTISWVVHSLFSSSTLRNIPRNMCTRSHYRMFLAAWFIMMKNCKQLISIKSRYMHIMEKCIVKERNKDFKTNSVDESYKRMKRKKPAMITR